VATCDPDDVVKGVVFGVTGGELAMADDYEAGDQRVKALLGLGELEDGSPPDEGGARTATRACGSTDVSAPGHGH
jgi:hypothetical protein